MAKHVERPVPVEVVHRSTGGMIELHRLHRFFGATLRGQRCIVLGAAR